MTRKAFPIFLVCLLAFSLLTPIAAASSPAPQVENGSSNATETPTATEQPTPVSTPSPSPDSGSQSTATSGGQYDISMLRDAGTSQGVDSVPSARALGDPPKGFVAARYRDPTLIDSFTGSDGSWEQVETGNTARVNEVQVYGSAFGEMSGEYDLVIVFWQPERVSVANGTEMVAANQTVKRQSISFEREDLYSYHNVSLPEHLDSTWETTMWIERGGQKMDGAQWQFKHRSNPESSSVNIDSASEAWGYALRNAILPGVVSMLVAMLLGRKVLDKTGRGPGYGVGSWVMLFVVVGMMISVTAYYEIAVILDNLPYVMGLSLGVIAFGAALTFHEPVERIAFLRRELYDMVEIPGGTDARRAGEAEADGGTVTIGETEGDSEESLADMGAEMFEEFTEATFIDLPEVPAVRTSDGYRVPVRGLKPFFARLFAKAAVLDMSRIATREKVRNGRISDIIYVDPSHEEAVTHKPARIVRVLPIDTVGDDATGQEELIAGLMTAAIVLGPAAVGFVALDWTLNIGSVGIVLGAIATTIMAYSAEDGWIEFVPAPPHYRRAEDTLTVLQRAFKEAKDIQDAKEETWQERSKTAKEARKEYSSERNTITDNLFEDLGISETTEEEREDRDE